MPGLCGILGRGAVFWGTGEVGAKLFRISFSSKTSDSEVAVDEEKGDTLDWSSLPERNERREVLGRMDTVSFRWRDQAKRGRAQQRAAR